MQIRFHDRVERVHADVVAGAAFKSALVVFSAAVGFFEVAPAHREHRTAAVAAHHQAGVGVGVYPGAAVVVARALLHGVLRGRIYAVVDNWFVIFKEDDVIAFVALDVFPVDFLPRVFSLPQCADVEIVC